MKICVENFNKSYAKTQILKNINMTINCSKKRFMGWLGQMVLGKHQFLRLFQIY